MFNEYIWKTYLKAEGRKITYFFEKSLTDTFSQESVKRICALHDAYCPESDYLRSELSDLVEDLAEGTYLLDGGEYNILSAMEAMYDVIRGEEHASPQVVFNYYSGSVAYLTTLISMELPDLFVPYYFQCNFNVFERIAWEFEIELPPIPLKKDYKGRFFYYGEVCAALQEFREAHGMSPYELCAFLYDFAPKYIGGVDSYIIKDLPEPKSVFFIGGAREDDKLSENSDVVSCWQCSPDTKVGDLIVMYLRTPISSIDSVWRSVSVGFNDPFFYYYRCTYIARPQKINRITQKQLQQDAVFKELPIIKKNMQGINGVEIYPSVYNHLLDIAGSDLPRLEYMTGDDVGGLAVEKDVENKLIKPFLEKLGYSEDEYIQQLPIEVGNHNHKQIPDFVIHPKVSTGHQSADFLLEAKLSIPSIKSLEEAKTQARGYAKLLNAKYSVVAAKEGIWISQIEDDYSKDILSFSWAELKKEDDFFKVYKLIGNGKV